MLLCYGASVLTDIFSVSFYMILRPFCSLRATFVNVEEHYAGLMNVAVLIHCPRAVEVMMTVSELKHSVAADRSGKRKQRQVV